MLKSDSQLARAIDKQMMDSVLQMETALGAKNEHEGFDSFRAAITQAAGCFQQWGLVSAGLQQHMDQLITLGAVAAKPTGAGVGGYALSLWLATPPPIKNIKFIAVFAESEV